MAQRPAFSLSPADSSRHPVQVAYYDFDWSPGMSAAQKRKNVAALHASIRADMLQAFSPASPAWQAQVWQQGLQAARQALQGLSGQA